MPKFEDLGQFVDEIDLDARMRKLLLASIQLELRNAPPSEFEKLIADNAEASDED